MRKTKGRCPIDDGSADSVSQTPPVEMKSRRLDFFTFAFSWSKKEDNKEEEKKEQKKRQREKRRRDKECLSSSSSSSCWLASE